jgi:hypothetical protein
MSTFNNHLFEYIGDFVSFKLDIDHSDTEMPIALNMLKDKSLSSLVDEFFFELHFQCDVMTSCGWGKKVCMYVCMCVYIYLYVYIYIHVLI